MKLSNSKRRWSQWVGIVFLTLLPIFTQAQINLTLPDTSLKAGETMDLPIFVDQIDSVDGVISGEFSFTFNENIIDVVGFNKMGTLLEPVGSVVYFQGTDKLAFASTDTVSGSGVLVYLQLRAKSDASYYQTSSLNFSSSSFNEGNPGVTTTNGNVQIEGVTINPKNGIKITKGSLLQFSLSGYVNNPVSWVSSDTSFASIDENGLLTAKEIGFVTVTGTESQGLSDATQLIQILPQNFSDLTVSIPDSNTTQTLTIDLPVRVSDLTGLGVLSAELDLNINASHLTLQDVIPGEITSMWGNPTLNVEGNRIQIASAGTDTLVGAGTLYSLRFKVNNTFVGTTNITINSSSFNEDLSATNESSRLSIAAAPDIQISTDDTELSIGNNIQFTVENMEGTAPYTWQSSDSDIATIDSISGEVTGVSRGDITIQVFDSNNFTSNSVNVRINDFDAYLDSVQLVYTDTVSIGLFTQDLSSYSITSYESEFSFDSTKLTFVGADIEGTQTETAGLSVEVRDTSDIIKIAAAGSNSLSGTNSIINFKFTTKESVIHSELLNIDLLGFTFNEPSPQVPTVTTIPGQLLIKRIDPPAIPSLQAPTNEAINVDTMVTFSWPPISEADSYTIQLSKNDTFTNPVIDSTITVSQLNVGSLEFESTYFWRVKAENEGGESGWSVVRSFTTIKEKPEIPVLLSPADGDTEVDTLAQFVWNVSARAESYVLELSSASDFSTIVSEQTLSDTTTSLGNLSFSTEYSWRVKATNSGGESAYSSVNTFTVKAQDASIPELLSPADNAVDIDTLATLTWNTATGAVNYQLQLSTALDFSSARNDFETTDTTFEASGLNFETEYFWRVRAFGAVDTSEWSTINSFTTILEKPEVPVLLLPEDGDTEVDTLSQFTWRAALSAETYTFQVSSNSNFSTNINEQILSDTTISIGGLAFLETYFWRVKASNSSGESEYSQVNSFMVKAEDASIPGLLSPENNSQNTMLSPEFIWNVAEGATEYEFQLSSVLDFSTITEGKIVTDTTFKGSSDLNFESEYYWRVRGIGLADTSDWSNTFTFTTKSELLALSIPQLITPKDDSVDTPTSLTFIWSRVESATDYIIEVDSDTLNQNGGLSIVEKDTSLILSDLVENTEYRWRVKAVDSLNNRESNWTLFRKFTVKAMNTLPVFVNLPDTISFFEDEEFDFEYGTVIEDAEDEFEDLIIEFTSDQDALKGVLDIESNILTLSSNNNFTGETTLGIKVTDSEGGMVEDSILVSVQLLTSNENDDLIPLHYSLSQNYPNPFNPTTSISFSLPESGLVQLEIYNMLGQKIKVLIDKQYSAGTHTVNFDASSLSSGFYIYRLLSKDFVSIKKMTLIK